MANTKIYTQQLLPEEQVRQWFLQVLGDLGVEKYRIATEYSIQVGGRRLRIDIAIFEHRSTKIRAIVECKAPQIPLTQKTIDQAFTYNTVVGAEYIILTNGTRTIIYDSHTQKFVEKLPLDL